jgi:hypothetical protein
MDMSMKLETRKLKGVAITLTIFKHQLQDEFEEPKFSVCGHGRFGKNDVGVLCFDKPLAEMIADLTNNLQEMKGEDLPEGTVVDADYLVELAKSFVATDEADEEESGA